MQGGSASVRAEQSVYAVKKAYDALMSGAVPLSKQTARSGLRAIEELAAELKRLCGVDGGGWDAVDALARELGAVDGADPVKRDTILPALLPILLHEHVILENIFAPRFYQCRERYPLFRTFIRHSPFGSWHGELRDLYRRHGAEVDLSESALAQAQMSNAAVLVGIVISVFMKLAACVHGDDLAFAQTMFDAYSAAKTTLMRRIFSEEIAADGSPASPPSVQFEAAHLASVLRDLFGLLLVLLADDLRRNRDLSHQVAQIFLKKATYSIVHHKRAYVGDINLAEAFSQEKIDIEGLLRALKCSHWIDRDDPPESTFFRKLTDFGRPMFSVFSEAELATIRAWAGEQATQAQSSERPAYAVLARGTSALLRGLQAGAEHRERLDPRRLYHRLVNDDVDKVAAAAARQHIDDVLHDARIASANLPAEFDYFRYSPSRFFAAVDAAYQVQLRLGDTLARGMPQMPLELLTYLQVAGSPVALIDGAWLQSIPAQFFREREITDALFQIYYEEVGNGEYVYNHAKLYRDLLRALKADVADIHEEAFIADARIPDGWFVFGTFMLSLAREARRRFPELLGWTLSTELAGLGGVYQFMHDQLERNELDSRFYRVHISADNLSSGHSSMATAAIVKFMEHYGEYGEDDRVTDTVWERIWTGFRAYRMLERRMLPF